MRISPFCRRRIASPSVPSSASPSTIARTAEAELRPGDFLLLTTDGFFEWANPQGELFGTARLIESALRARSRTSADIIKSIYSDVIAFSGGTSQDDDVTAVVVKRKA